MKTKYRVKTGELNQLPPINSVGVAYPDPSSKYWHFIPDNDEDLPCEREEFDSYAMLADELELIADQPILQS